MSEPTTTPDFVLEDGTALWLKTYTAAELATMQRRVAAEQERRALEEHAEELATSEPSERDLDYLDHVWYSRGGPVSLREGEGSTEVLRWLWGGVVVGHEANYGHECTVRHVGAALAEHLEALLLGAGGEDTTDLRDLAEEPKFGGRGCLCTLEDVGGPESGPQLSVDVHERCPRHAYLLAGEPEDGPWGCPGHPAGPDDPMGQTVYCDGSCVQGEATDWPTPAGAEWGGEVA